MKYLSIDIGTTGGKIALFSNEMELLTCWRRDYPTWISQDGIRAEQNSDDWWELVKDGIKVVLAETESKKEEIAGIGISCMTPVLLPIGHDGKPLCNAWLWYDRRASDMVYIINEKLSQAEQIRITGSSCKENSFFNKLLYFREKMPDLYKNTACFLQASGYLVFKMTGKVSMDSSHGEICMLTDKVHSGYSQEISNTFALEKEKLPELISSDCSAGNLTEHAATELGLQAGIPVVSGGHDSALSAYALGIKNPGEACLDIGNAANLVMCTSESVYCSAGDAYRHPIKGKWLFQIYSATIGAAFRWFKECFGDRNGASTYNELCEIAATSEVGARGVIFLPYLQGAQQDSNVTGSFLNIRLGNTFADFVRALLEGCAYSIRYNMEQMQQSSGIDIQELIVCGGGANNRFWLQIYADILNVPLVIKPIKEAAVTGAAMLIKKAVEGYESPNVLETKEQIFPDLKNVKYYDEYYQKFKDTFEKQI